MLNIIRSEETDIKLSFARSLKEKYADQIILVDDKSIFSLFYQVSMKDYGLNFKKISCEDFFNEKVIDYDGVILCPIFKFRVYNVNYNQFLKKEFGKPYFVHIASNVFELIKSATQSSCNAIIINALDEFPALLATYLNNALLQNWLTSSSSQYLHNDLLEREILARELKLNLDYDLFASDESLKGESFELCLKKKYASTVTKVSYMHYPMHRIYKKYLNRNLDINLLERDLYGEVDK